MPAISKATRQQIKGYLEGFIEGMLQEYRQWRRRTRLPPRQYLKQQASDAVLKPFHDAILPEEFRKASAFERSFSTRSGATFEECARLIAAQHHALAQRGYRMDVPLDVDALNELENQLQRLDKHESVTIAEMIQEDMLGGKGTYLIPVQLVPIVGGDADATRRAFVASASPPTIGTT